MGKGSTHEFNGFRLRTRWTPNKNWQCFIVKDGHVVHFEKNMKSEELALRECKKWLENEQRSAV